MLYGAEVAVGSELITKQMNAVWWESTIMECYYLFVHHVTVDFRRLNCRPVTFHRRKST